eukprot:gene2432-2583_t
MKLVSLNFHSNVILRNSKPELEKYSNPFLQWVSILLPTGGINSEFEQLDWTLPKRPKSSMGQLIIDLEKTLKDKQWFVTGLVDPTFFLNEFQFKDPNVEVVGIQNYAQGVRKIFDSRRSKMSVIDVSPLSSSANNSMIRVTWKIDAVVNIMFGFKIKPYIIYSDLEVDNTSGLICSQKDSFTIPEWKILFDSILSFLDDRTSKE